MQTQRMLALALSIPAVMAVPDGTEWGATFAITAGVHKWSMQKVGCDYADPKMKIVIYPVSGTTSDDLEGTEASVVTDIAASCQVIESGETLTPAATGGSCYELHIDATSDDSEFIMDLSNVGSSVAIWAQHVPIEFERNRHYFYDNAGIDIEPVAEEGGGSHAGHDHGRRLSKMPLRRQRHFLDNMPRQLSDDPHAGHDHGGGDNVYEWAGTFPIADSTHVWSMQKVGGEYADPAMWLVLVPAAADASETDVYKGMVEGMVEAGCTVVEAGESMKPAAGGSCFELHVDCSSPDSFYTIDTTGLSGLAVYAQHVPLEFERDQHFLKDSTGEDIETVSFEKRWGPAIGAALAVNMITLTGVILMVPFVAHQSKTNPNAFAALANSFAAGALIACAFFLMFPEGYLYVTVGSTGEGNAAFMFGIMVLCGVITASLIDLVVHVIRSSMGKAKTAPHDAETGTKVVVDGEDGFESQARVLGAVLIGDFAHNFIDGIFIGVGFSGCSNTMAWGIATATILHEIAQEIADYIVLTDPKKGNLKPVLALALNFISGLSVVLGVVIVMSLETIEPMTYGAGLVFGGGIYIQIGLAEAMARVYTLAASAKLKVGAITLFSLGALAIGAILFGHEHCVPEGDDSHEGHDHGRRLAGIVAGHLLG